MKRTLLADLRPALNIFLITMVMLPGLSAPAFGQTTARKELAGGRHAGPGAVTESNATYAIGLSLDGGATFVETARLADTISITGIIRPEPEHVGQTADIFIVDRINIANFEMRTQDGVYVPWNGNVASLIPWRENQVLTNEFPVEIFTGTLGVAGDHRLFLGYLPADGILRYTPTAHRIDITTQSAREQAEEFFPEAISTNIVQAACIACHVSGGAAQGLALHTFVRVSNANHLTVNFNQFENLVMQRGRQHVLSKVLGGLAHGGGQQLVQNSQEYRDLDSFLTLLEQL
jgi:hypothetical protein